MSRRLEDCFIAATPGSLTIIHGASPLDQIFSIEHEGEIIYWNITRMLAACRAGEFGVPRYVKTASFPPADWGTHWGPADRRTVDDIKTKPAVLDDPAIAIESPDPRYCYLCFADGQHRITARQELGLEECGFYVVPWDQQERFLVSIEDKGSQT